MFEVWTFQMMTPINLIQINKAIEWATMNKVKIKNTSESHIRELFTVLQITNKTYADDNFLQTSTTIQLVIQMN